MLKVLTLTSLWVIVLFLAAACHQVSLDVKFNDSTVSDDHGADDDHDEGDGFTSSEGSSSSQNESQTSGTAGNGAGEKTPPAADDDGASPIVVAPSSSHILFRSSSVHTGNLGGLAGADAICHALAAAANLQPGRPWKAILSDSRTSAKNRISINGPVFDVRGVQLKAGAAGFYSGLDNYVHYSEQRQHLSHNFGAWTGTLDSGMAHASHCGDWMAGDATTTGSLGSSASRPDWISHTAAPLACNLSRHLYCITQ